MEGIRVEMECRVRRVCLALYPVSSLFPYSLRSQSHLYCITDITFHPNCLREENSRVYLILYGA